jgi:hypothetical protein
MLHSKRTPGSLLPSEGTANTRIALVAAASFFGGGGAVVVGVRANAAAADAVLPVAAVVIGALAVAFAWQALRGLRVELASQQARYVFMTEDRAERDDGSVFVTAHVHNNSDGSIWRVQVRPLRSGRPYDDGLLQTVPDIPPGEVRQWQWVVSRADLPHVDRHARVLFWDAQNVLWERVGPRLRRCRSLATT